MTWFIELFAGTSALSRVLIGGMAGNRPRIESPVGYMGAKNDLAPFILHKAGLRPGDGAWKITLNDFSTIGNVTRTLLGAEGQRVADTLRAWKDEDPRALWFRLRDEGPPQESATFAASWLWLQARAASGVPVWWNAEPSADLVSFNGDGNGPYRAWQKAPLVSMDGHGPYPAWQATGQPAPQLVQHEAGKAAGQKMAPDPLLVRATGEGPPTQKGREESGGSFGGIRSTVTIARRIEAMRAAMCGHNIKIVTMRAADYAGLLYGDIGEAVANRIRVVVYMDPPYQGATGYELGCPRDTVLGMAMDLRRAGAEVIVSEAEGLPLKGWHQVQLPSRRKPEWLTMSHPPGQAVGDLFVGRAV